jgi:hypothetical protein
MVPIHSINERPPGAAEGCEAFILTYRHRSLRQLLQVNYLLREPPSGVRQTAVAASLARENLQKLRSQTPGGGCPTISPSTNTDYQEQ